MRLENGKMNEIIIYFNYGFIGIEILLVNWFMKINI